MKMNIFICLILLSLLSSVYSFQTEPLQSDGTGRTNHPVLFVHGRFSQSAKTFGVHYADVMGSADSFDNFRFNLVWDQEYCTWDSRLIIKHFYVQVISDITFKDGRIAKRVNKNLNFKFASRAIEPQDFNIEHIRLDSVVFDPLSDVATIYYSDLQHPIEPGKRYTKELSGQIMDKMRDYWTLQDISDLPWEGKAAGAFDENYPDERDLVMHYDEGTTPDVIADELQLDVSYLHGSPKGGINSNGLYFFNAKKILFDTQITNGCDDTQIDFVDVISYDSIVGARDWPDGLGFPFVEPYYSRFTFRCNVTCLTSGQVVPIEFTTYVDSIVTEEWKVPKPNMQPYNVSLNDNILTYWGNDGDRSVQFVKPLRELFTEAVIAQSEFNDTSYIETGNENDPTANCYWESTRIKDGESVYGQPNQLVDRMVEVMNDFYGEGNWEDDPTKVIDIVANSMGGTSIRIALAQGASVSLANPLNHINRIVATGAPHLGSAFSTDISFLNSNDFSGLIDLKEHLFQLKPSQDLVEIEHVLLPNEAGIFLGTELDIHLDFKMQGLYFGPFDLSGGIYWNHFSKKKKFKFDNTMVEDVNKSMSDIRSKLIDFELDAKNIALAVESPYTRQLKNLPYPVRLSDGSRVELTNFYINGVPNFLSSIYTAALPYMEYFVNREFKLSDDMRESKIDPDGATKAVMKALTAEFDKLKTNLLDPLDAQWCSTSDLIIDVASQKGINPDQGFETGDPNTPFYLKEFTRKSTLAHLGLDLSKISGGEIKYTAGAKEGTDIAGVLLEYPISVENYPRPSAAPVAGYWGYSRGAVAEDGTSYLVDYQLKKSDLAYYGGPLSISYFVKADPKKIPQLEVLTSGGMTLALSHIGGELFEVKASSDFVEFNRGGYFPSDELISFKLSYNDGSSWNPASDWSCSGSETVVENSHLVVWDSSGTKVSGIEPDYSIDTLITEISLEGDVRGYSRERSYNSTVSQPSLSVENMGDEILTGFHAYYYFTTPHTPQMSVFWMAEQDKASWELIHIKDSVYAAHITYEGISVAPGGRFDYIEFEVNNEDWSTWYFDDDHSYLQTSTLKLNSKIVITDLQGNALWGESPFMPEDTTTATVGSCFITARDEATATSLSTPRIRLFNDGNTILNDLRIYYYFTTENGKVPSLEIWDVPLCDVSLESLGENNYRVIYRAYDAGLEPGEELPNIYGSVVGLHYNDWSTWNSDNDYSHGDLSGTYVQTDKIIVEDGQGNLLWGVYPEQ